MDVVSYLLSRAYVKKSLIGLGAIKGSNAMINSIVDNPDGTHDITFAWKDTNDVLHTSVLTVSNGETPTITVTPTSTGNVVRFETDNPAQDYSVNIKDGISVTDADVNASNHLIITLSDGTTIDAGEITTVSELSGLDDVTLTTPQDGDCLSYNATSGKWENRELSYEYAVEDLTDVDINTATLADGDIIRWDATNSKWVKGQIPTIENLDDIGDVTLTELANGQIIKYDAVLGKWVNEDDEVIADLDDLQDVVIDTATLENGQILKYDSVRNVWYNGSASAVSTKVEDLEDVSIDPLTFEDGQILAWDATNEVWVNKNNGANIQKLDDVGDVDLTSLVDGQIIVWDATAQKWINAELITTLENLSDVSLANLQDNDILRFDSATNKWYNTITDIIVTENSANLVSSGAVFTAIKVVDDKIGALASLKTTDKTTVVNAMNEVFDSLADLIVKVGDLTLLTTTDKTTIVNAINEIVTNVGDLTTLTTTDKTTIVNAINEVLTTVKGLKYLEQLSTMVEAGNLPNRVVQFVGSSSADYTRGYIYRSTPSVIEGEVVYSWVRLDVQPNNDDYETLNNKPQINDVELVGNKSLDDLGIQKIMQYAVMPTPSVEYSSGVCVQYLGNTTDTLKTGYFYVCKYITEDAEYKWVNIDVSSNAELAQRLTTVENNIGDMSTISIAGVTDLVGAINVLAVRGIKAITYTEPYLNIVLADDTTFSFDITIILNATDLGELGNVIDTTIQNGELLQYDASILKYKPYNITTTLGDTLQSSKDYTDQQIAQVSRPSAYFCDSKPSCSYDSSTDQYIVVYYQNTEVHTTTDISSRFYYYDTNNDAYCTSWFLVESGGVTSVEEMSYSVASVNFEDYVNKNTDVVSTYTTTMVDKSKVPDIAALDALYDIIATALGLKTNVADIVDSLLSDDATVPLSAKQGKVLKGLIDEKQPIIQMSTMPQVTSQMVTDKIIYQYVGDTSLAYTQGYFYLASYNSDDDVYYWKLIEFAPDMVEITAAEVDNLWA